ncbi:MAG: hypothetical protein VX785_10930 [Actinomycetota bacterium]|nr:hypothetical protein [Acidimicrobiales bacterium]MED5553196.1 hypothetical protein [Actinomycetota bacterium]
MRTKKWRILPLLTWTFVVWVSRVRNVLVNQDLDRAGVVWRLVAAGIFIGSALLVLVQLISGGTKRASLNWLAAWSVGFWVVRGGEILIDGAWSFGFKAIHAALMATTFATVALAISGSRLPE